MACRGSVQEGQVLKACWLPVDISTSPTFCRRCHFQFISKTLDTLIESYKEKKANPDPQQYLESKEFLKDILHPAREQALFHLLSILQNVAPETWRRVSEMLREFTVFSILLSKKIQSHIPGTRCSLYQEFMKHTDIYGINVLPWNCWCCLAWILRKRSHSLQPLFLSQFPRYFLRITHDDFTRVGPHVFVDVLVSFHLLGFGHFIKLLLVHMIVYFPLEEVKHLMTLFFQEPCMLPFVFLDLHKPYLPVALQDDEVLLELKCSVYKSLRKKMHIHLEELMMKTWHPSRILQWCFDIDDLADF